MTNHNHHQIVRQVLELELLSSARAPELQEAAARLFRDRALPDLEALFDRIADPDNVLRVDRLELDLGDLTGANWQEHFYTKLLHQLEISLERATHSSQSQSQPELTLEGRGDLPFQHLMFVLSHGRLPWWGEKPGKGWAEACLQQLDARQWQALGNLLHRDIIARRRLIYTVRDNGLAAVLKAVTGLSEASRVLALLTPPNLVLEQSQPWRQQFWTLLLELVEDGMPTPARGQRLMQQLLVLRDKATQVSQRRDRMVGQRQQRRDSDTVAREFRSLPPLGAAEQMLLQRDNRAAEHMPFALPQPWQTWLEGTMQERGARQTTSPGSSPKSTISDATADRTPGPAELRRESQTMSPLAHQDAQQPKQAAEHDRITPGTEHVQSSSAPFRQSQSREQMATQLPEGEAVYLEGAGAVILHPFLEELFRSRGLLQGRAFHDEPAQHRAVYLLSYLTFGSDKIPEYDLLLPKLLCGLPWAEPLPSGKLNAEECNACEELLSAVLSHWSALKSNSTTWLRQQFFLRQGKIERVGDDWKLSVERHLQDFLLDRLPWGIGLIQLPWLPGLLHVSWTD